MSYVVYQVKDTIFWKQITTAFHCIQLYICCLSSQRYNFLKANHNASLAIAIFSLVVYQVKDTIFWKQITTRKPPFFSRHWLFIKSKIQFFESKSQRCEQHHSFGIRCLSSQRYNFLKANHNVGLCVWIALGLFIKSKIQFFESKSQPIPPVTPFVLCCLSSQRYNFLKANHNMVTTGSIPFSVVYQVKDTIFWKQITTYRLYLLVCS